MATLKLYESSPAGSPGASHQVTAPGGYEWWYFDAEDAATDTRIVIAFFDGCPFDPPYVRRYLVYRWLPTWVRPPVPAEYPSVYVSACRGGRVAGRGWVRHPAGSLRAADHGVEVGAHRMDCVGGAYHVRFDDGDVRGEVVFQKQGLSISSEISTGGTPVSRPGSETGSEPAAVESVQRHHWVAVSTAFEATGTITVGESEVMALAGTGYHDHRFGDRPIGARARIRAQALMRDRALARRGIERVRRIFTGGAIGTRP